MDIASLARYAFISLANTYTDMNQMMLFFTPCEELQGGSIFMKLSANYNIVRKYVERIDVNFVKHLNVKIRNFNYYLKAKSYSSKYLLLP